MRAFVGQYDHQMDEKGRVSLPSAFRRDAGTERLVLVQWESSHVAVFPEEKWQEVVGRLLEYRRSDPKGWNRVRSIVGNAEEVSPDKQGRILVPASLRESAGLSGAVMVCGNIDRIELWDPDRYETVVEKDADDLSDFAHRLFG